ncbi:hypothetical protein [Flavobacterium cerinum]|uniref:Uncharacterized protein n=1 Tax=Flavobacterium cerinum TaxID=2502784 RepID=A0ABY5IPZ1_9FLAO|nr:hypothetical protein [Flavobacterium cerinum]UUC44351.1 hypothetical protein NOX80_11980 [Flavobacterium cerinum]
MKLISFLITVFKPVKSKQPVKNYDTFLGLDLDSLLSETGSRKRCPQ